MQIEQIVALLIAERDRLSLAIEALHGSMKRSGHPSKAGTVTTTQQEASRRKRQLSSAGRKAIAEAARRRWAAIRAGKAPSPFAKAKPKK